MPDPESLSRDEVVVLAREQAVRISGQDVVIERQNAQIAAMAGQIADLMDRLEQTTEKLARLEHLLSRNSANSNFPSSKDGTPGGTTPSAKPRRTPASGRKKGKQKGAPGSQLRWTEDPDDVKDLFPQGGCDCGRDLDSAVDLGVVDRFQQHEVPLVAVTVTQYEQHAVSCAGCGQLHTAPRPEGAGAGRVEYGPQLKALAIYLMVMHHLPVERCCDVLESFTGARPSTGFVHGLLTSTAAALGQVDQLIRTLITLAYAVCCDETPIKSGPATPPEGKKKAEQYLHVACTELYTHYLLGDRSMDTFTAFVYRDLHAGAVIVHDRYINYDSTQLGTLTHQLDTAHLLRDLTSAAETYPDAAWPGQITDALRELIHRTNQARRAHHTHLRQDVLTRLTTSFRHGVRVGLSETLGHDATPGQRTARHLLHVLHDREADVLRFAHDLKIPPTSNQAERDLRPAKLQDKISGRLPNSERVKERYLIRGVLSTARKHGQNLMPVLRDALCGHLWHPPAAATLT